MSTENIRLKIVNKNEDTAIDLDQGLIWKKNVSTNYPGDGSCPIKTPHTVWISEENDVVCWKRVEQLYPFRRSIWNNKTLFRLVRWWNK